MNLPKPAGPLAWSGTDDKAQNHFIVNLEVPDIVEIKAALGSWKDGINGDPASVSTETFPLPNLGLRLGRLTLNLHDGSGFAVLRGLDTTEFSAEDNMLIYLGICSWVGSQRGKIMCPQSVFAESLLTICRSPEQEA